MVNASNSDSESDEEDIEDAGEVAEKNAGAWDEFLPKEIEIGKLSFDIYVKNSRGRNRMFPLVERKRRVDLYGESIDIKGWLERNLPESMILTSSSSIIHPIRSGAGAAISSDELNENGKRPLEEEEEIDPELLLPHKFVRQKIIVSVQCGVWCCDMEGKSDGKAIRRILGEIAPRRLVNMFLVSFQSKY